MQKQQQQQQQQVAKNKTKTAAKATPIVVECVAVASNASLSRCWLVERIEHIAVERCCRIKRIAVASNAYML